MYLFASMCSIAVSYTPYPCLHCCKSDAPNLLPHALFAHLRLVTPSPSFGLLQIVRLRRKKAISWPEPKQTRVT
jgi:hypothetical protein